MHNAMLMFWDNPKNGRESIAGELFQTVSTYFAGQKQAKKIEGFEPVLLNPYGGKFNGFFLIRGTAAQLNEMRESEEFLTYLLQAGACLDGFGVVGGVQGSAVGDMMAMWAKTTGSMR